MSIVRSISGLCFARVRILLIAHNARRGRTMITDALFLSHVKWRDGYRRQSCSMLGDNGPRDHEAFRAQT
jgi:hypothetical protein